MLKKFDEEQSQKLIPKGCYCYQYEPVTGHEDFSQGVHRLGFESREFESKGDTNKGVLCPFWNRTEYGTIRCDYTGYECIDDYSGDGAASEEKIRKRFKVMDAKDYFEYSSLFFDMVKVCEIP